MDIESFLKTHLCSCKVSILKCGYLFLILKDFGCKLYNTRELIYPSYCISFYFFISGEVFPTNKEIKDYYILDLELIVQKVLVNSSQRF